MNIKELTKIFRQVCIPHVGKEHIEEFLTDARLERADDNDYHLDQLVLETALKCRVTYPTIAYDLMEAFLSAPECRGWWRESTLLKYSKLFLGEEFTDPKVVAVAMRNRYDDLKMYLGTGIVYDTGNAVKTIVAEWLPICYPDGYNSGWWWIISRPRHLESALGYYSVNLHDFLERCPYLIYELYVLVRSLGVQVEPSVHGVALSFNEWLSGYKELGADPKQLLNALVLSHYKNGERIK